MKQLSRLLPSHGHCPGVRPIGNPGSGTALRSAPCLAFDVPADARRRWVLAQSVHDPSNSTAAVHVGFRLGDSSRSLQGFVRIINRSDEADKNGDDCTPSTYSGEQADSGRIEPGRSTRRRVHFSSGRSRRRTETPARGLTPGKTDRRRSNGNLRLKLETWIWTPSRWARTLRTRVSRGLLSGVTAIQPVWCAGGCRCVVYVPIFNARKQPCNQKSSLRLINTSSVSIPRSTIRGLDDGPGCQVTRA